MEKLIKVLTAIFSKYPKEYHISKTISIELEDRKIHVFVDAAFITVKSITKDGTESFSYPTGLLYKNLGCIMFRELSDHIVTEGVYAVIVRQNGRSYRKLVCRKLLRDIMSRGIIWNNFPKAQEVKIVEDSVDSFVIAHYTK